jgi:hypothetical protein
LKETEKVYRAKTRYTGNDGPFDVVEIEAFNLTYTATQSLTGALIEAPEGIKSRHLSLFEEWEFLRKSRK